MTIIRHNSFKKEFAALPDQIKKQARRKIGLFLQNYRHPSLRSKKMEGQRDGQGRVIWEARVTQSYRFTFVVDGDTYILRHIGTHDILDRP